MIEGKQASDLSPLQKKAIELARVCAGEISNSNSNVGVIVNHAIACFEAKDSISGFALLNILSIKLQLKVPDFLRGL